MSTKTTNLRLTYDNFMKQAHARKAAAESLYKSAADEEARTGIKDPNCKGTVSIPGFGDGADRSALRLPESAKSNTANEDAISLCNVSKPAGTGEGSYITPVNGDAKDEAAKSPTAALSKIARQSAALKAAAAAMAPAETMAPETTQAPANVELPAQFSQDSNLMSKLASISATMLATEEGRRAVSSYLEKEAGRHEVNSLIAQVRGELEEEIQKSAAAYYDQTQDVRGYAEFRKEAALAQTHEAWLESCQSDLEKIAYAQGAMDGAAAAEAMEAGAEPTIPGAEGPTEEDLMQVIQELVASGQVSPQEVEAVLALIGEAAADGVNGPELAAALEQAVQSGQMTPADAEMIAEQVITGNLGGDIPVAPGEEDAAMAAAEQDPVAAAAANESVTKAASVINYLWN